MTSLGRSPRKPKESSAKSRFRRGTYATAGDFAAEAQSTEVQSGETEDVDTKDEGPASTIPELTPEERIAAVEETAKVSALASAIPVTAQVIDEPRPKRPAKEPKPPREPRVKKERPKKEREPKPPREKREKKARAPKPEKARPEKIKAEKPVKEPKAPKPPKTPKPPKIPSVSRANRILLAAGIIGGLGLLLSITLAVGAFFIASDVAQGSSFVERLSNVCDFLVGPLNDVFHFTGANADKKESFVGWAIGSLGYLLLGRFLQSVLQSRVKN